MLKKNIHLIVLISLGIFLFLIGLFFLPKLIAVPSFEFMKKQQSFDDIQAPDNKEEKTGQGGAILEVPAIAKSPLGASLEKGDSSGCLEIKDNKARNQCLVLAAERLSDLVLCLEIKENKAAQDCEDRVNYKLAIDGNDIDLCQEIKSEDLNQSCVIKIISLRPDLKSGDCEILPEKEKSYCLNYLISRNDRSIYQAAQSTDDCDQIITPGIKELCLDNFAQD